MRTGVDIIFNSDEPVGIVFFVWSLYYLAQEKYTSLREASQLHGSIK
jgi:uncharacterized membrane protein YpjA